jgi:hypothetical protein
LEENPVTWLELYHGRIGSHAPSPAKCRNQHSETSAAD